jgi:phosphatidylethanolamine/phosphatidyl-N-methylethanolamine N-methyltransferase
VSDTSLADNLRFIRALITRPKNIGALFPSSPQLAAAIAGQIDPAAGPVLEIGPGTGVVSQAILDRGVAAENLTLLEYDEDLAAHVAARFARATVIQGDAFNLDKTLGPRAPERFAAIVSGIPLLNHPVARRSAYMEGLARRLMPGAPLVQFSYGTAAPVVPPPGFSVVRAAMVWVNIPPARVWVYRKI